MGRRPYVASVSIDEFSNPKKSSKVSAVRAGNEVEKMRASGDFSSLKARHLVALHMWLHSEVYGVPESVSNKDFARATHCANNLVKIGFGGEINEALSYLKWVWSREMKREKSRSPGDSWRLNWKFVFVVKNLVDDYRVAKNRFNGGTRAR